MKPLSTIATIGFFFIVMALALLAPHLSETDAKLMALVCGGVGAVALFIGLLVS